MQHTSTTAAGQVHQDLALQWLSRYAACCHAQSEEAHPGIIGRVLPAIEAAVASPTLASVSLAGDSCGVTLDLTGLCVTLSDWTAALCSFSDTFLLRRLTLRDANLGDAGLRTLAREAATSHERPSPLSRACESAKAFSSTFAGLEGLDLSGTGLTDAGPLSLLLSACPRLLALHLSHNHLGSSPSGLGLLCAALQVHPSVAVVDLCHNYVRGVRGGVVLAGLAELVVARSVSAASRPPLCTLDLSQNLLGHYYLAGGGPQVEEEEGLWGSSHRDGHAYLRECLHDNKGHYRRSDAFSGGGVHEAVTAFPLVTALYLNNTLQQLDLRDNGLPDALVEYVDAKLHVNRPSQAREAVDCERVSFPLAASATEGRVTEVLQGSLQHALTRVRARDAEGSNNSVQPLTSTAAVWSSEEVSDLLKGVVQSIAAGLSTH